MQSNGARFAVLGAAIAVIVVLFLVLGGGDDEEPTTTTTAATATEPDEAKEPETEPEPKPEVPTIVIEGGQPVGGVQEFEFTRGEDIFFRVRSDTADHVHFHGYDIFMDIAAGGGVTFNVPADVEGVFEVELEDSGVPIAEITVSPA